MARPSMLCGPLKVGTISSEASRIVNEERSITWPWHTSFYARCRISREIPLDVRHWEDCEGTSHQEQRGWEGGTGWSKSDTSLMRQDIKISLRPFFGASLTEESHGIYNLETQSVNEVESVMLLRVSSFDYSIALPADPFHLRKRLFFRAYVVRFRHQPEDYEYRHRITGISPRSSRKFTVVQHPHVGYLGLASGSRDLPLTFRALQAAANAGKNSVPLFRFIAHAWDGNLAREQGIHSFQTGWIFGAPAPSNPTITDQVRIVAPSNQFY
eukprot:jgi/Bigna1/142333/aug1.69_g17041